MFRIATLESSRRVRELCADSKPALVEADVLVRQPYKLLHSDDNALLVGVNAGVRGISLGYPADAALGIALGQFHTELRSKGIYRALAPVLPRHVPQWSEWGYLPQEGERFAVAPVEAPEYVTWEEGLLVRSLGDSDLDSLAALWQAKNRAGVQVPDWEWPTLRGYDNGTTRHALGLFSGSSLIGAGLAAADGEIGMFQHFMVREDMRGRGLGAKLVQEGFLRLKRSGCLEALIAIEHTPERARFWERLGFVVDDTFCLVQAELDG